MVTESSVWRRGGIIKLGINYCKAITLKSIIITQVREVNMYIHSSGIALLVNFAFYNNIYMHMYFVKIFLLTCFCPVNGLAFQSNLFQTLIPTNFSSALKFVQ